MRNLSEGRKSCVAAGAAIIALYFAKALFGAEPGFEISAPPVRIKRLTVDSTNLASAGYDRDSRVLEIEFRSGAIYRYHAVQPEIFENLMRAASKGRYFVREIRGKYEFRCVRETRP
jgi:hypothetical protein